MLDNHTHRETFIQLDENFKKVTEEFFKTIAEYLDANMEYLKQFLDNNYYFYARMQDTNLIQFRVCQGFFTKSSISIRLIKII